MSHGEAARIESSSISESEDQGTGHKATITLAGRATHNPTFDMPHPFQIPAALSVAVDPVALITTECITVTSAMRKHARWAHSSVSAILGGGSASGGSRLDISRPSTPHDGLPNKGGQWTGYSASPDERNEAGLANRWGLKGKKGKNMQDNPLMTAFARLRSDLNGCKGIRSCQL